MAKKVRVTQGLWLVAAGALACSTLGGCGKDSDIMGAGDKPPFDGRNIKFNSTYVYFPSDFSMSIVRDTMPQDEACRILNMYSASKPPLRGLPVLPYKEEHYSLVITVDSVMPGDDVTLDTMITGGPGDMRYAGVGQYPIGNNQQPSWAMRAGGVVRVSEITQYKRVAGKFNLQFLTGERIEEDFAVDACPK
jgi:hypothetical protein